jgi:hypothetical protein
MDVQIPISRELGDNLLQISDLIIAHVSAEIQQRLQSGISEWDGEERPVSKAAEGLVQVGKISSINSFNFFLIRWNIMAHQLIMMDGSALFPSATFRKIFG